MQKTYLLAGIILCGLAVVLGAFGAHGLKKVVTADLLAIFQTGVQYQMYHGIALILVAILFEKFSNGMMNTSGIFFLLGILLFSGSLYAITGLYAAGKTIPMPVGIVTPIGGLCFIIGWLLLLIGVLKG
jgi:uncharacterized membrane protein YgdD (TMEM256/DUF423 family)